MNQEFSIGMSLALLCCAAQAAESPPHDVRVLTLTGQAFVSGPDAKAERPATTGEQLNEGEVLRTGKGALAELEFPDSTSVRLAPLSKFHYTAKTSNFTLDQGEGIFSFPKGKGGFTVSTPAFAASIQGTTVYVKVTRNVVEYACLEGRCRIGPHTLTSGEKLALGASGPAYAAPKQKLTTDKFLKENQLVAAFTKPLPHLDLIQQESRKK
ncbi:MAG TPA: FecR family protein [Candidatus Binatia bacterium]|jgi:hypothetical protein|nr:FecR family protein [Candidatus Binatia bacterium]